MKTAKLFGKVTSVLCTVLTLFSLFAIPVFAAAEGEAAEKQTNWTLIISLIVAGVIVVAAVVLCIIFREKVKKFLRVYKSEMKKITWLPWNQTRKSTLVVLVVLVVFAVALALIDLGLQQTFMWFIGLFQK